MRNPFRRQKALTATPAVLDAIREGGWSPYPLLGGGGRDRIVAAWSQAHSATWSWIYERSPAVRSVVDVIVRNVGQLDLRLYEEIDESERQPRPDHPAALSLRYPSLNVNRAQFVRSMFKDFLLYDDAFALLSPASGGQFSLNRLPPDRVEVGGEALFDPEWYRFYRENGTWTEPPFSPAQIMHWHGENPRDPRVGLSRLEALRAIIAEDVALRQAMTELANAGLTDPVWAFRPLDAPLLSAEAETGLEEDLTAKMYRRNRRVTVTQEGTELRSFGVSPRDAQMLEIRREAAAEVAAVFGVPKALVGLDDNVVEARSLFYSDTLPPYCEDFTAFLNHRVLVQVYGWQDGCFEFNLDEKHMGDDRMKALVSATGRAVMLTNEARAKLNLPPVDTGDELVTPLNVIVGDNPKPSTDVMGPQNPNGPSQEGDHREEEEEPKALQVATDPAGEIAAALRRLYNRQRKALMKSGGGRRFSKARFARELITELRVFAPNLDQKAARAVADGLHEALYTAANQAEDGPGVFKIAADAADIVAESLVATLGLDPRAMRDLGVPDEVVWQRAGFQPEQIDEWRAMQYAQALTNGAGESG